MDSVDEFGETASTVVVEETSADQTIQTPWRRQIAQVFTPALKRNVLAVPDESTVGMGHGAILVSPRALPAPRRANRFSVLSSLNYEASPCSDSVAKRVEIQIIDFYGDLGFFPSPRSVSFLVSFGGFVRWSSGPINFVQRDVGGDFSLDPVPVVRFECPRSRMTGIPLNHPVLIEVIDSVSSLCIGTARITNFEDERANLFCDGDTLGSIGYRIISEDIETHDESSVSVSDDALVLVPSSEVGDGLEFGEGRSIRSLSFEERQRRFSMLHEHRNHRRDALIQSVLLKQITTRLTIETCFGQTELVCVPISNPTNETALYRIIGEGIDVVQSESRMSALCSMHSIASGPLADDGIIRVPAGTSVDVFYVYQALSFDTLNDLIPRKVVTTVERRSQSIPASAYVVDIHGQMVNRLDCSLIVCAPPIDRRIEIFCATRCIARTVFESDATSWRCSDVLVKIHSPTRTEVEVAVPVEDCEKRVFCLGFSCPAHVRLVEVVEIVCLCARRLPPVCGMINSTVVGHFTLQEDDQRRNVSLYVRSPCAVVIDSEHGRFSESRSSFSLRAFPNERMCKKILLRVLDVDSGTVVRDFLLPIKASDHRVSRAFLLEIPGDRISRKRIVISNDQHEDRVLLCTVDRPDLVQLVSRRLVCHSSRDSSVSLRLQPHPAGREVAILFLDDDEGRSVECVELQIHYVPNEVENPGE